MTRATPLRAAVLAAVALWLAGCGPKLIRDRTFDQPTGRVELRHREEHGQVIEKGYSHPATIADVRMAHILANLVYEDEDEKQRPVIRSEQVYELASAIAKAFAQAKPDDEIAAAAFVSERRLGIFTEERVTAFRVYLQGEEMKLEFYLIEAPLEKDGNKLSYREWEIPSEYSPRATPPFKLVPGEAQARMGGEGVSVAWRDDVFRRPVSLRDRDGKGRRRTVLMELPPDKAETATAPAKSVVPSGLSDAQIRALDQVEAARSNGQITELEYQRRRKLILENKLDEAGYGTAP